MAKLFNLVSFLCLFIFCSGMRLQKSDMEMFRDKHQEKRLNAILDEDEPEAIRNTNRLLEAILFDEATIKGGSVEWYYRKGELSPCIDGKKKVDVKCRWTGLVKGPGESEPEKERLQVLGKYCRQAGLNKPEPKLIDC